MEDLPRGMRIIWSIEGFDFGQHYTGNIQSNSAVPADVPSFEQRLQDHLFRWLRYHVIEMHRKVSESFGVTASRPEFRRIWFFGSESSNLLASTLFLSSPRDQYTGEFETDCQYLDEDVLNLRDTADAVLRSFTDVIDYALCVWRTELRFLNQSAAKVVDSLPESDSVQITNCFADVLLEESKRYERAYDAFRPWYEDHLRRTVHKR